MFVRLVPFFAAATLLIGCDMVSNVHKSTDAIVENRQAVESATDGIRQNREVVTQSSDAIQDNLEVVQSSTTVIRENAEAVKASTEVIKANAAVVQAATAMMPKVENKELTLLFVIGVAFFLFGLPLITAHYLSRITRKLTRLEKELKKR